MAYIILLSMTFVIVTVGTIITVLTLRHHKKESQRNKLANK